jgi:hypothetical protein
LVGLNPGVHLTDFSMAFGQNLAGWCRISRSDWMPPWIYQPNGCKSRDSARIGPGFPQGSPQNRRMKEASARIKINRLLENAGWRFFADGNGPDTGERSGGDHRQDPSAGIHQKARDFIGREAFADVPAAGAGLATGELAGQEGVFHAGADAGQGAGN